MRARSLKPSICDNELLGTADPFCTLLFERLWMMADREGRLEDRPKRIKAQAFPYRDGLDVEPMLVWLHDNGFIRRYIAGSDRYIQVVKFLEHQSPHCKEAPSKIPAPCEHRASTVPDPEIPALAALTPSSLTPDSGLLTADSGLRTPCTCEPGASTVLAPEKHQTDPRGTDPPSDDPLSFEKVRASYPKFTGRQDWILAEHHCRLLVEQGETWETLEHGAGRYAAFVKAGGVSDQRFVMTPGKFFSAADKPWLQPWTPPPKKQNASERILNGLKGGRVVSEQ